MKKTFFYLAFVLCLFSFKMKATKILECRNGIAYMHDQITSNGHVYQAVWQAGGCCCENWYVVLRTAQPRRNLDVDEASPEVYASFNTIKTTNQSYICGESDEKIASEVANNTIKKVWLDPRKVDVSIYTYFWESFPDLGIYDVNVVFNGQQALYRLKLYSDKQRTIIVNYKDGSGLFIKGESIDLLAGANNKPLNTSGLTAGLYNLSIESEKNIVMDKIIIAQ